MVLFSWKCVNINRNLLCTFISTAQKRKYRTHTQVKTLNYKALPFIYGSGAIGVVLFTLIIKREIDKIIERKRGFERLVIKEFGSRTVIHRHKDTILFDVVAKNAKGVASFEARPDDVWVVSFPRSGTTWLQEIVYLISTNLDFTSAKSQTLDTRYPYLEFEYPGLSEISKYESPRYIKSHLPYHLLPDSLHKCKPKIIYIARNPRDVILSYYFYARMLQPLHFTKDFNVFADLFLKNLVPYAPWWNHVLQFWQHREDENILFITYEQLHKKTRETIKELAGFLGKSLSEDDISAIIAHCDFNSMKQNNCVNYSWFDELGIRKKDEAHFMRSGKIGEWQGYFDSSLNVRVEQMLQSHLNEAGLYFDYFSTDSQNK